MGTNFYFIPKISDEAISNILIKAKKLDKNRDYSDVKDLYNELQNVLDTEIHLGKRSCGWQFLWNHNDLKYYQPNLESIQKFLKETEGTIKDEYGDTFTYEQFFENEVKGCLYADDNHITIEMYDKAYNTMSYWHEEVLKVGNKEYKSTNGEFIINDLRFATTTEFS